MNIIKRILPAVLLSMAAPLGTLEAGEDEKRTTLQDQKSVAVTIYNENLALVKDRRTVKLDQGFNKLAFRGVSAQMRPETAMLRNIMQTTGLQVIEQNFDFDLLTPQKLLEKYVGKSIRVATMNPATGVEKVETAKVLSTNNGTVLQIGDRIEINPTGRLIFDGVPANLRDKPTLVTQLNNSGPSPQDVELSYLTGGLSWKADYVAELNADDNQIDLLGWVTLNNQSGTTYKKAKMQLVAGDVNRVRQEYRKAMRAPMAAMAEADMAAPMQEESLFEYHLYTLGRPTTIADKQTKQVSLMSAAGVPVSKQFLLQGNDYYYRSSYGDIGQKMKIGVFVELNNKEESGMGMPLPKGVIRVYKKDKAGNAQFIGEDRIDHTPKNETIKLKLGEAFDITADKKQTAFRKRSSTDQYHYSFESAYEIKLKNAKDEPVTVTVREPIPGDWEVLKETHPHEKVAAGTAEWKIEVPAEGSSILKYRVIIRY